VQTIVLVGIAFLMATGVRAEETPTLDGDRKSLVVVGYSTSFLWPSMLQYMLDQHAGKVDVYHVLNAAVGGSPVVDWLEGQDRYNRTYAKLRTRFLANDAEKLDGRPRPTIALCQQSLQGAFGDRRAGIRSADDGDRIRIGADTFSKLANQLHEDGIQAVYIAAHIYKAPMEPEIGNERLALEALLDRQVPYVRRGPELWEPTKAAYPEGFSKADKVHPSIAGARIMAEGWYRALAGNDVQEKVIQQMYAEIFPDLTVAADKREAARARRQRTRNARRDSSR
jgi:hypothetical protein